MLKKIKIDQLVLGMHITEFCGSWMEHPFWKTGFVLTDMGDLSSVLRSSIKEVWIDVSKGLDIAIGGTAVTESQAEVAVERDLQTMVKAPRADAPLSTATELARAAKICFQSKQAVISMFQEARMGKAVDVGGATLLVEEITDSVSRNPSALISLARLKTIDDYTYMHSVAVCAMMVGLSKQLGQSAEQTRLAGLAGLMHDLGKAMMPIDVLNKPGKLTSDEFSVIKTHPVVGHRMLLTGQNVDPVVLDVCLSHHEKVDGSGYPYGTRDSVISVFAKMGAVCDVYDAITSNRPYKLGWDPAESLRKMAEWSSGHFDKNIFQAFVKSLGIYPIGSLVRLTSGRLGVVIDQTGKSLTMPVVKVFFSTKANMRITPVIVDLSLAGSREKIMGREDPAVWKFSDLNELWSTPT